MSILVFLLRAYKIMTTVLILPSISICLPHLHFLINCSFIFVHLNLSDRKTNHATQFNQIPNYIFHALCHFGESLVKERQHDFY